MSGSLTAGDACLLLGGGAEGAGGATMVVARVSANLCAFELLEPYGGGVVRSLPLSAVREVRLGPPPAGHAVMPPVYRPWLAFSCAAGRSRDTIHLHAATRSSLVRLATGVSRLAATARGDAASAAITPGRVLWAVFLGRARHRAAKDGVSVSVYLVARLADSAGASEPAAAKPASAEAGDDAAARPAVLGKAAAPSPPSVPPPVRPSDLAVASSSESIPADVAPGSAGATSAKRRRRRKRK